MKSTYVIFPEKGKVEVREEPISPPGPGEVLCATTKSLISIGTETYCLRGIFDPGSNWASWVQYPFRPGYSVTARVVELGQGVTDLKEGDRVSAWMVHQSHFTMPSESLQLVPEGLAMKTLPRCPSPLPRPGYSGLGVWSQDIVVGIH